MKLIFTLLAATLILSFQYSDNSKQRNTETNGTLNLFCPDPPSFSETVKTVSHDKGTNSGTDEIDQDWYSRAMEQIEKEEYNISFNEELGAYQSPNRANNIRFIFHKDGLTAITRDARRETQDEIGQRSDVRRQTRDGIRVGN